MQTNKKIILNNEEWILDYETGKIYQSAVLQTSKLPLHARIGDYPFREFRGALYFETENKFYKIVDFREEKSLIKALEIDKEEYEEIKEYRTIDKRDPATLDSIRRYVVSVIVDAVMSERFDLRTSIPVEPSHLVNRFSKKFTPEIRGQVERITKIVIATIPSQVKRKTMKQQINVIYQQISQEDGGYTKDLLDKIYLNDKDTFDYLSESILNSRNSVEGQIEERDYDIKSSLNDNYSSSSQNVQEDNQYYMELFDLIGILEDFEETELIENYGISMQEYLNPTAETIRKVKEKLNSINNRKHR